MSEQRCPQDIVPELLKVPTLALRRTLNWRARNLHALSMLSAPYRYKTKKSPLAEHKSILAP